MIRSYKTLRALTLGLALLFGGASARAAEVGWPAAFSKTLTRTAGASNLVKLGQQDRAEFDRVATFLGKALQGRNPRITPASVAASPDGREIAEFIGGENAWARKIAENPYLENSPAGRIAAAARAKTLVEDLYPILEGSNYSALQAALPALKEQSRKAFKSAHALAEQLVAESREENAPAPPPAPPVPPRPESAHLQEMRLAVSRAVDMMLGHNFLRGHNTDLYEKARNIKEVILPIPAELAEESALFKLLSDEAARVLKSYEDWLSADKIMMPAERERRKAEAKSAQFQISQLSAGSAAASPETPSLGQAELQRVRESFHGVITLVGDSRLSDTWLNEILISARGLWTATAQVAPGHEKEAVAALLQKGDQLLEYYKKIAGEPAKSAPVPAPKAPAEPPKPLPSVSYSLYPAGYRPSVSADQLGQRIIDFVQKEEKLSAEQKAKLDVWIKAMKEIWRTAAEVRIPELQAEFQKGILMRSRFLLDDYRDALKALALTDLQKAARRRVADILAEEAQALEKSAQRRP